MTYRRRDEMITTGEAKKILDEIEQAAQHLRSLSALAAEKGVRVTLNACPDVSVDYQYYGVWVDEAFVDLNWISPAKLEALGKEDE